MDRIEPRESGLGEGEQEESDWSEIEEEDVIDSESSESEGEVVSDHPMPLRSATEGNGYIESAGFKNLVKEILGGEVREDGGKFGIRSDAIDALQKASEQMLVELFEKANELVKAGGREKVSATDLQAIQLCEYIAKESGSERNPPRTE